MANRQKGFQLGMMAAAIAAGIGMTTSVQAADSITAALTGGKVSGNIRLRYEEVDQDGIADQAEGMTIRTRLGYETKTFHGFSALVEFEDIRTMFGYDEYAPEQAGYPIIADPEETEVNRGYLRYRGISKLDMGYGRQRIIYDNARFVGNVGWRQDEQTFDAFTANYTGLPDWTFNYAYLDKVEGITSQFDANVDDHLANIAYNGFTWGKFVAYSYLLDHTDETDPTVNADLRFNTNDTIGLRFEGAYALPTQTMMKLLYAAEFATQEYETQTGVERDTDYLFGEVGINAVLPKTILTAKLSYEELGSDDGLFGFRTPFATKHAFNGWADKFLATPNAGLEDTYVTLQAVFPAYSVNALVMYHEFDANDGSADFGNELDLQVFKTFGPNYTIGIKYAMYEEGDSAAFTDTDKFWLWGEINF